VRANVQALEEPLRRVLISLRQCTPAEINNWDATMFLNGLQRMNVLRR